MRFQQCSSRKWRSCDRNSKLKYCKIKSGSKNKVNSIQNVMRTLHFTYMRFDKKTADYELFGALYAAETESRAECSRKENLLPIWRVIYSLFAVLCTISAVCRTLCGREQAVLSVKEIYMQFFTNWKRNESDYVQDAIYHCEIKQRADRLRMGISCDETAKIWKNCGRKTITDFLCTPTDKKIQNRIRFITKKCYLPLAFFLVLWYNIRYTECITIFRDVSLSGRDCSDVKVCKRGAVLWPICWMISTKQ